MSFRGFKFRHETRSCLSIITEMNLRLSGSWPIKRRNKKFKLSCQQFPFEDLFGKDDKEECTGLFSHDHLAFQRKVKLNSLAFHWWLSGVGLQVMPWCCACFLVIPVTGDIWNGMECCTYLGAAGDICIKDGFAVHWNPPRGIFLSALNRKKKRRSR